ncbi:AaceriAFR377Cp [[Ashbya] aceris (nom. inval.)]|nr:AaceriAFR377Cp [[Ashbya] aceris (nom. inval.)]
MSKRKSPHDFVFREELGHGSYSTVYRVVDRSNQHQYAIKICSKRHIIGENKVKYVTIEKNTLNLLGQANHPGIIKLYYTFHDQENLYFVMDLAPGGELLQLLHRHRVFSEAWARHYMLQLVDTVEFIHSMGVIHRDLKPENVLLDKEGRLMIADFGAAYTVGQIDARSDGEKPASSFVGTAEYVSPELLLENKSYYSSDVWALGCMLYQFLQGTPPFRGQNEMETFERIVSLDYSWRTSVNPLAVDLVSKILVLNPSQRYTLDQIKKHKWFSGVDWNNKEKIWRGSWSVAPEVTPRPRVGYKSRQLLDTPIKNIPVVTQRNKKPTKMSSTSSIVEWRKMLGLSGNDLGIKATLGTNGLPMAPLTPVSGMTSDSRSDTTPALPKSRDAMHPVSSRAISSPPSKPSSRPVLPPLPLQPSTPSHNVAQQIVVDTPRRTQATSPYISPTVPLRNAIWKQDLVQLHEIPYTTKDSGLTLAGFSQVSDTLIANLISHHANELRTLSRTGIFSLDSTGHLSFIDQGRVRPLSRITDPDLSIYEYQLGHSTQDDFLILEKYRRTMWIVWPSKPNPASRRAPVKETWAETLSKYKKQISDEEELSAKLNRTCVSSWGSRTPSPTYLTETRANAAMRPQDIPLPSPAKSSGNSGVSEPGSKVPPRQLVFAGEQNHKAKSETHTKKANNYSYAAPTNIVLSSSRYEVLRTVNNDDSKSSGAAVSGASAAFRTLRVNK